MNYERQDGTLGAQVPTPGTKAGDLGISATPHRDAGSETNTWVQVVRVRVEMRDRVVKQGSRESQCKEELSKWLMLNSSRMFCRAL